MAVMSAPGLSAEQGEVFGRVLDGVWARQVQTVGGYAGTGKTVLVSALADALPDFATCAFTGKAAHVLRRKGVAEARTIHGLIYWPLDPPPRKPGDPPPEPVFRLKEPSELMLDDGTPCAGFLVDEASMVGRDLYGDLLSFGLPCVFVGDHGQLPPVGNDVHLMKDPDFRLETVHRNAGPIAHFAEHLRKGGTPWSCPGLGDAVRVVARGGLTDGMLLGADQILCAFNRTRVALNARVRALLGRTAPLEEGDRVICLRNSRRAGLFNGMQGVVRRLGRHDHMDFVADDGREFRDVPFDRRQFGQRQFGQLAYEYDDAPRHPFDYAYAVTCHKGQGSEWGHVLVQEQWCRYWEHARWTYTAASRARERLTWAL
jgi:exodeoxyribonuclease-5